MDGSKHTPIVGSSSHDSPEIFPSNSRSVPVTGPTECMSAYSSELHAGIVCVLFIFVVSYQCYTALTY
jgi:hypothetical protein